MNDTEPYEVDGTQISWVQPGEATRYLGKMFGPWGWMTVPNLKRQMDEWSRSVAAKAFPGAGNPEIPSYLRLKARILHSRPSLSMLKAQTPRLGSHQKPPASARAADQCHVVRLNKKRWTASKMLCET